MPAFISKFAPLAGFVTLVTLSGCSTHPQNTGDAIPRESTELQTTPAPTIPYELLEDLPPPVSVPAEPSGEPGSLWQRLRDGFQLSHDTDRKRVQRELDWYLKNPAYVQRVANRAKLNMPYIVDELERRGLPLEFALLPIVESAYQPFAYSHGRAAGLWQFVPGTARVYGLRIDWWYDGRRDVRASTRAAIDYLEHLHDFFNGDWLLAIAAYNAGEGNVRNAVRKSNAGDFWSLSIFRETYHYVPRLLAISALVADPARYNFTLPELSDVPFWEVVDIGSQLDLNTAAKLADLSMDELYELNAGYNQWATHPKGPHELLIPVGKADAFREKLATLPPEERVAWTRHRIRNGESLGTIARRHRTTIGAIKSANQLTNNTIIAGDHLLIPSASKSVDYAMTAEGRLASKQSRLADKYGAEPINYTVRSGDSFWKIARAHKVGMRELARWNGLGTSSLLRPGMTLKIFKQKTSSKTVASIPPASSSSTSRVQKLRYRVREGESLSRIASKFNVSVASIRQWNDSLNSRKYIHPGDNLTLYVDVTRLIN